MKPASAHLTLGVLLLSGCSSVLGLDDFQAAEAGSGETTSATTTGPEASTGASTTTGSSSSGATSSTSSAGDGGGGAGSTSSSEGGAGGGGDGGAGGTGGAPPAPTCTDGEQNGNEGGIDCGGDCPPCEVVCPTTTHECAPTIPDWEGPIALVEESVGCELPFPDPLVALRTNLNVPAASCDCSCSTPDVACGVMSTGTFYEPLCVNLAGGDSTSPNVCITPFSSTSSHDITLGNATSTCAAGSVASDIPEPAWATNLTACGGFGEAGTCDGSAVCIPSPEAPFEEAAICIYRAGEVACPASYPTGVTYYDSFEDGRSCPSTCSCTVATPATCEVVVTRHTSNSCGGTTLASRTVSSGETNCAVTGSARSMRPGTPTVDEPGTCAPGTAPLTGTVDQREPTTVCCR